MYQGKTLLIVDDDRRNIFALSAVLKAKNIKLLTAIDGNDGLKMLNENPHIDLVLLDMMMPVMDGYETLGRIRATPRIKDLPVISLTARAMVGDREKCMEAGATDYISKPVDTEELFRVLNKYLLKGKKWKV